MGIAIGDARNVCGCKSHFLQPSCDMRAGILKGMVGEIALGDLSADGVQRVKGGHGLLKDDGDVIAAHQRHVRGRQRQKGEFFVVMLKKNASLGGDGRWQQTHDGKGGHGFAATGFSHQCKAFAFFDGE